MVGDCRVAIAPPNPREVPAHPASARLSTPRARFTIARVTVPLQPASAKRRWVSIEPDASAGAAATAARRLFDAVLGSRGRAPRARREAALQHGAAVTGAVRELRGEELGMAAG